MKNYSWGLSLTMASVLCFASPTMARTITVTNLADSGQGSLRAAITSANEDSQADTIRFKKHLSGTIIFTSGPMDITSELMIDNCTFIGNEVTLGGTNYGGAIGNFGRSQLDMIKCVFDDNTARGSGANEKAFGGAIATRPGTVDSTGSMTEIDSCRFRGNRALSTTGEANAGGGALFNERSTLWVEWNSFLRNEAVGRNASGGAIMATGVEGDAPLTQINRCHFTGNMVEAGTGGLAVGGALHNTFGLMGLTQTTIDDNLADGGDDGRGLGGGLYNLGTVTADQKTRRRIVDNWASTCFDDAFGLVME